MTVRESGLLHPQLSPSPSAHNDHAVFSSAGSTHQNFVTPAGARMVSFGADCNFAVRFSTAAILYPSTQVIDGSGVEVNPGSRYIGSSVSVPGIAIISPSSGAVSINWYK